MKWRRVCCLPNSSRFGPLDTPAGGGHVNMTVDEYETIRLIDLEGLLRRMRRTDGHCPHTVQAYITKPEKSWRRPL
jgi:hypothetical protein